MIKKSIGRNDKCPCGSGKKYKYCCINNDSEYNDLTIDDYINEMIDYGNPQIDELFFLKNSLDEKITAQRLVYSKLFYPELEKLASELMNKNINRNNKEKHKIENANNIDQLIDLMKNSPDNLYHELLKKKLLDQKEIAIPIILSELNKPINDVFLELAISIIYFSAIDCSKDLINIISKSQENSITAYVVSQICMLLGFYDNDKSYKLLWNYFHHFKKFFPNKSYAQGPLLGLIEIFNRKSDKKIEVGFH